MLSLGDIEQSVELAAAIVYAALGKPGLALGGAVAARSPLADSDGSDTADGGRFFGGDEGFGAIWREYRSHELP
ncbi:hypothetical protein P5V94_25205 [Mycobacteroides abscessus subsp. abscessus]|nr:hypothetical protein [Mycobacteroides abscessus]MDO3233684.1 hypothetical protein [Mycobacteroides abscessus subsp. abscessus]